jgi:hypothetical protein
MQKLLIQTSEYTGYRINGKYPMVKSSLDRVIAILEHARDTMCNPVACHLVIYWKDDYGSAAIRGELEKAFRVKSHHRRKWKSHYEHLYFWVNEKSEGVIPETDTPKDSHTHLMLIYDVGSNANQEGKCFGLRDDLVKNLAGVRRVDCLPRTNGQYWHDLNSELLDAVFRFSYLAKAPTKEGGRGGIGFSRVPTAPRQWITHSRWTDSFRAAIRPKDTVIQVDSVVNASTVMGGTITQQL